MTSESDNRAQHICRLLRDADHDFMHGRMADAIYAAESAVLLLKITQAEREHEQIRIQRTAQESQFDHHEQLQDACQDWE